MIRTTWIKFILSVVTASFALFGCVTVKLGGDSGKKAEGVTLREPSKPFERESRAEVDAAWKNSRNGNVISYLSDCNDPADPPLNQVLNGVVAGVSDLNTIEESTVTVQGREGRRVHASGKVDGVPTELDILAFKRNRCIYILSYVGVRKFFPEDHGAFNTFIEGFRAP